MFSRLADAALPRPDGRGTDRTRFAAMLRACRWPLAAVLLSCAAAASPDPSFGQSAPAKPTGFTTQDGNTQVRLRWTGPTDPTVIRWQFAYKLVPLSSTVTATFGDWTDMPGSGSATKRHTVTGLINNRTYKLRIRAVNDTGPGPGSDERTAAPYPAAPAKPEGFEAMSGNRIAVLTWADADDVSIQGWEYRQKDTGNRYGGWLPVPGSNANTTSYTVVGLENAAEYTFQIRAYNNAGSGYLSDERSVIPILSIPREPTGFMVESGNRKVTLSWSNPSDDSIEKWQYAFRTTGDYRDWTDMKASNATTVRYVVAMLENDIPHAFKIRAINSVGSGIESNEIFAIPEATAPGKPLEFAVLAGDKQAFLSWTDPFDASISNWQYTYRTTGGYEDWQDIPGSNAATTGYAVNDLANGTTYVFKVRAVNDVGPGSESDEATVKPLSVPTVPTGFKAVPGDGQVVLAWDNPLNATITRWQYSYRTVGDYGDWTDIPDSSAATNGFAVTGLTNGLEHGFRIRAVNDSGYGAVSEVATAMPQRVPAKPAGLRAEAGNTQVRLVWTDPQDSSISGWRYSFRTTADYGPWTDIPGSSSATTRYTVTALTNDTTYTLRIRAVNGSGAGPESDGVSATPWAAAPDKPTGFEVEAGDGKVVLTWDDPDDSSIEGWQFKHRASDGDYRSGWDNIPGSDARTVRHVVAGLENGETYVFKIRAVNSTNGYESDERSAAPRSLRPAAPTGLNAEAGDGRVTLSWDDPGDPTIAGWQYTVGSTGTFGEWMNIPSSIATTTDHTVSGLDNGSRYTFKLRATNVEGEGEESGEVSATPVSVPAKPSGLTATPNDKQVRLDWDDPGDATIAGWQYRVAAAGAYDGWTDIAGSVAGTTRHVVSGLENGAVYRFQVRAVNASGSGAPSDEVSAVPVAAPARPTGLTATPGSGWVLLEWDDPADPTITIWEYRRRKAGEEFEESWTPIPGSNAATASYRITGLEIGASYGFQLRASAGNRTGTESDEAIATLPLVPAKPQRLFATAGDSEVLLEWAALDDATVARWQYSYRTTGALNRWTVVPGSNAATTRHRVTGLDGGKTYGFRIRAVNSSGDGAASDEVTAVPFAVPAAPTGFAAAPGDGTVLLEWHETADPAVTAWQYNFRRSDGPFEEDWTHMLSSSAATSRYIVNGLENGVSYAFKLRALAGGRIGRESEEAAARPAAGLPAAPENLRAKSGDGQVELVWDDPLNPAITGWQFRYRTTGPFTDWRGNPDSSASLARYTVTGLVNGVTHYFQLRARTASGPGPPSETAAAAPELAKPEKPTGLKVFPGDGRVQLTWDGVSDSTLHWEYVGWAGDAGTCRNEPDAWEDVGGPAIARHTITGLINGVTYCFRVRTARGDDPGPASNPVSATPRGAAKPAEREAAKAGLSSLAGRLAAGAEGVIGARFSADPTAPRLVLAGHDLPLFAPQHEERARFRMSGARQPAVIGLDREDALRDSAFQLPLGPSDGGTALRWSLWHRGELKVFRGSAGRQAQFGGRALSAWYGLDLRRNEHWLTGVAVAHSKGEVAYAAEAGGGVIKTTIDSVHPYFQRQMEDGPTVWLTLGGGRGTIETSIPGRGAQTADARMATVAAGFRGPLLSLLTLKLDASGAVGLARFETGGKAQTAIGSLAASADRQSLDLAAALEDGDMSGYAFLSVRRDGGDGVRGLGVQLSSGVRSPLPAFSGNMDIRARWTGRHSDRDYREIGLTATVRKPAGANGRGPSWSLAVMRGTPVGMASEARSLWSDDAPKHGGIEAAPLLNLRAGWRFLSRGMMLGPHAELVLAGADARQIRLGLDLGRAPGPMLAFAAERRVANASAPETRLSAALQFRF